MAGRPRKYTIDAAKKLVDEYLQSHQERPTLWGLARHMKVRRETIYAWCKEDSEFSHAIYEAMAFVGEKHEERLYDSKGGAAFGSVHWLRCHGMDVPKEVSSAEVTGKGFKVRFATSSDPKGVDDVGV